LGYLNLNRVKVGRANHNQEVHRMLRTVSEQEGFHFCVDVYRPTEHTAHSLAEFVSIVKTIEPSSIEFHLRRGDFEKWFTGIIGDNTLSARTAKIGKDKNGEELRKMVSNVVTKRYDELRRKDPAYTIEHTHG
jgi:hypothetical protein